MTPLTPAADPAGWVARLGRALRREGVPTTPHESLAALRALEHLDVGDPLDLYYGLRSVFLHDPAHFAVFDRCFRELGGLPAEAVAEPGPGAREEAADAPPAARPSSAEGIPPPASAPVRSRGGRDAPAGGGAAVDPEEGARRTLGAAYSPAESLARRAHAAPTADELAEADRALGLALRRLATRRSRRLRPGGRRGPVDLRRSLAGAVRHDGELIRLARRRRRIDRPRVVLLCDVSGSMARYGGFLLRLLLAASRGRGVEAFAFGTRLTRLGPDLGDLPPQEALEAVGGGVGDWAGGTRIGDCLRVFLDRHGRALLGRRTVVVILSDGLDRGDPAEIERAMRGIRRRARRIVWLNPLLESRDYQPEARGMKAALPFVDDFAPGHSFEALLQLGRLVGLRAARPGPGIRRRPTPPSGGGSEPSTG